MSFDGPIPGQSLTNETRNHPWERPPETVDPDEAIKHHLTRFSKPKVMDGILDAIDRGYPVSMLTELVLSGAVAQGIHSIDLSMMIGPVVHEYLVNLLEEEGVEFDEFFPEEGDEDVRKSIAVSKAIKGIKESSGKPQEEEEELEEESMEEEMMEEPKRGLMARPEPEGDMS